MSRRRKKAEGHINHERWMVSFADFMTLLFALFVVLFAVSSVDQHKYEQMTVSVEKAFGVVPGQAADLLEKKPGESAGVSIVRPIVAHPPMEALRKANADTNQKLEKILKNSEQLSKLLRLRKEERGSVLQLQDSLFFASGSSQLRPEAFPVLKKLAQELHQLNLPLRIEGHTDNVPVQGGLSSNWELSALRATQVLMFLAKNSKIQPSTMSVAGYGEFRPIASNQTESGRARNRRVDIVVLSSIASLQEPVNNSYTTQSPDQLNQELEAKLLSRRK
ncbi:hypothetical protein COW36_12335 [bacterium (Candidatus Blackallbacteria) CG17_big_fil_post_rev_8_21_14_2_50_48_46]|uniref:OmpA-like domain-containing protein n=1 Tax=bacterium (Candidatus Blackallbacteria) CG17_big_fil_post_rev_8_21_14_2_50_48_46 TaxID=2014261 RepID=A0A2M7G3T4_9BACT|nr:MAG: hypothetical protein COW64_02925 [bacterium (Candidatus Blackallbacteria) CG18_big_fil_WC_8_21_14_2_50_49_26]PIW16548.1 MAG: hypothetical protein COW36_12335 [bacterium (Candidatus Blackallbacteria) CG17_big_fil_post_rev_8_21_14_2_50_48_46]PIW46056.1 MAG: hypothetical protein COW20_17600 [bacterium (Candidatus Blackallbacteria) CG13_big_fil_rev_8_21_14_2_50_49_14]